MSMWLVLAKIEADLLEAVRADPELLAKVLGEDKKPMPEHLSVAFDPEADRFEADYRTLSAIADALSSQEWFDKATSGTESLDYELTYGPAFVFAPGEVNDVAIGLLAEGWDASRVTATVSDGSDEPDDAVQRSAHALGEAADWEPEEIEAYGPMMAATGSTAFNTEVVQAIGAIAGWDSDTIAQVTASVVAAEPEELVHDDDVDLAAFFSAAAAQGRAVVGGIS